MFRLDLPEDNFAAAKVSLEARGTRRRAGYGVLARIDLSLFPYPLLLLVQKEWKGKRITGSMISMLLPRNLKTAYYFVLHVVLTYFLFCISLTADGPSHLFPVFDYEF